MDRADWESSVWQPRQGAFATMGNMHRMSQGAYAELNDELRNNERLELTGALGDSVHTEFQEERDHYETAPLAGVDEYDPPPTRIPGYMQQSSPFSFDPAPANERSFMEWYPEGNATLSYPGEHGKVITIPNINLEWISERCGLLAAAFEPSRSGPQLHLETLTALSALPFLRYLYCGTYAVSFPSGDQYEDVPTSVLLHCQLFRLAVVYDLPELKSQAYVNVLRQCEFGCSSPDKPIDLCAAIRYVYEHLREHEQLIDAIINYCVACFLAHRLAEDSDFKQLAYDLRPFHQALCQNSMRREFENETAAAIIQMPFKPYAPAEYLSREYPSNPRVAGAVSNFSTYGEVDNAPKKRKRPEVVSPPSRVSNLTLALRQRQPEPAAVADQSTADEDHFTFVRKRRVSTRAEERGETHASDSEADYVVLRAPLPAEVVNTDSESDSDDFVDVGIPVVLKNAAEAHVLPVRSRTSAVAEDADSSSNPDSGWSFL